MSGFAGRDHQLEAGHMLGLRWFTLRAAQHSVQRVTVPEDTWLFGGPGSPPVYPDRPADYRCTCGYRSTRAPFPPDHPGDGMMIPVLRGARGNWYPGENEATCLVTGYAAGGVVTAGAASAASRGGSGGGGAGGSASVAGSAGGGAAGGTGGGGGGGGGVSAAGGPVWAGGGGGTYPTAGAAYAASRGPARRPHQAPDRDCHCGFWAYWSLGGVQVTEPAVVGLIKGYGRYEWGERGFRCSHAKILAVFLPHWDEAAALAIEDRYQCDVYSNFLAMLEMFRDRTPASQPPLTDSYFRTGSSRYPASLTAIRGLRSFAVPCQGCGHQRCAPGQALCAACQACGVPAPQPGPATLDGREALKQAHATREKWAAEAAKTVSEIKAMSVSWQEASARMTHLTAMLDAIGKRYWRPPDGRRY